MPGKRIGKAEKEQRIHEVYKLLVAGMPRVEILQYVSKKFAWNLSRRQVDNYIAEAAAILGQQAAYHRPEELGKAIGRLTDIFTRCMKVQDYARAIAAQKELNRLMSLYAPEQPKTILLGDVDPAQIQVLTAALQQHGMNASDLFNALIEEIASEEITNERE